MAETFPRILRDLEHKHQLSPGELAVIDLLLKSFDIPDIATRLGATVEVVRKRLSEIYKKLEVEGPPGPGGKLKALRKQLDTAQISHQTKQINLVSQIYGRAQDIDTLRDWIVQEGCRLIAILGERGIGKTMLAGSLYQALQRENQFERYYWIPTCPPIAQLLTQLLQYFQHPQIQGDVSGLISTLLDYLREYRCLLVLDQVDAIFASQQVVGHYREDYEQYRELFKRLGEEAHRSCVVLTSLVKLPEVELLMETQPTNRQNRTQTRAATGPVRTRELTSLSEPAALKIIERYIKITKKDEPGWQSLIKHYRGNPSALKMATSFIDEVLDGDVNAFLSQKRWVFGDISNLIEQQVQRLSEKEQEIIKIFSQETTGLSFLDLVQKSDLDNRDVMTALQSLRRRSLLDRKKYEDKILFTLPPLILEYANHMLISQTSKH